MTRRHTSLGYRPAGPDRRAQTAIAAAAVLAAAALAAGGFWLGRGTAPAGESSAAAPRSGDTGVPVATDRGRAGAAGAAVNFVAAGIGAAAGGVDPAAAQVLLSERAARGARAAVSGSAAPDPAARTSFAPGSVSLRSYTADRATALVWGAALSWPGPGRGATADWSRTVVALSYEDGAWKVRDQAFEPGPWPGRADVRFSGSQGDFAFRRHELRTWSYVAGQ